MSDAVLKSLDEVEREHIAVVLRATGGNRRAAAAILGVNESTLLRKLGRKPPTPDEPTDATKSCSACGEVKRLTEFPRNVSRADGRHHHCKHCHREHAARHRARNREVATAHTVAGN